MIVYVPKVPNLIPVKTELTIYNPSQSMAIEVRGNNGDRAWNIKREVQIATGTTIVYLHKFIDGQGEVWEILSNQLPQILEASLWPFSPKAHDWEIISFAKVSSDDLADQTRLDIILEAFGSIIIQLALQSCLLDTQPLTKLDPKTIKKLHKNLKTNWMNPLTRIFTHQANTTLILWRRKATPNPN